MRLRVWDDARDVRSERNAREQRLLLIRQCPECSRSTFKIKRGKAAHESVPFNGRLANPEVADRWPRFFRGQI